MNGLSLFCAGIYLVIFSFIGCGSIRSTIAQPDALIAPEITADPPDEPPVAPGVTADPPNENPEDDTNESSKKAAWTEDLKYLPEGFMDGFSKTGSEIKNNN